MDGKYSLNHIDFETNARNILKQLWDDQTFSDVTLATSDDKQIRAHKMILSTSSPFFQNILQKNPHQNPLLYLKDIPHSRLELILKFMYFGQCEVAQEDLDGFLATGKDLRIKGLLMDEEMSKGDSMVTQEIVEMDVKPMVMTFDVKTFAKPLINTADHVPLIKVEDEMEELLEETSIEPIFEEQSENAGKRIKVNAKDNGKFPCDECEYQATRISNLRTHKAGKHTGVKFPCNECGKVFRYQSTLIKHTKAGNHGEKIFPCTECGNKFPHPKGVRRHEKQVHSKNVPRV